MTPAAVATRSADPRIVERRRRVVADQRRRRRRRALVVLVSLSAVAGLVVAVHSPLLDTSAVLVTGVDDPARIDQVVEATAVRPGDPLLRVDPGGVAEALRAVPWVDEVDVERSFADGTLSVAVTGRTAVAVVATDGRADAAPESNDGERPAFAVVDGTGRVILETNGPGGLVELDGVAAPALGDRLAPTDQSLSAAAAALTPGLASRVSGVRFGPTGNVELVLTDGGVVVLGRGAALTPDELEVKARTLQTVLATVDLTCLAGIDVRVSDTAVVTRAEGCG